MRKDEQIELQRLAQYYLEHSDVQEMKKFIQHGNVTTYDHCVNVMRLSFLINRRMHLGADEKKLVEGALLHDFYLYDWHNRPIKDWTHSYKHPLVACENAKRVFDVDEEVQNMISCHMWPYTFWRIPANREAWIISMADKYSSLMETLFCRD